MKKTFVTALVVGSCMLASETASAQDAQLLAFSPESEALRDENRRRILRNNAEGQNREDTGDDENADGEKEPADEDPQEQEEQEAEEKEAEEKEEEDNEADDKEAEEKEEQEKEEQEEADEAEEKEAAEDQEAQEAEDKEAEENEAEEKEAQEADDQEAEEKEEQEQEEQEAQEKEEEEPEEKEEQEEQEPEEREEPERDDEGREVDEDGNPKVQEESTGPGGEEMVDDDETDPDGEARQQAQEEREQAQEDAAAEHDENAEEAQEEQDNAAAEQQDQAEVEEKEQADAGEAEEQETQEKEEADEAEEKDEAEADEKEEADAQEEKEDAEAEQQEQDEADEKEEAEAQEKEDAEADEQEQAEADEKEEAEADEKEEADAQEEKEDAEADEQDQAEADEKEEADDQEKEEADAQEKEDQEAEEQEQQEQEEPEEKEEGEGQEGEEREEPEEREEREPAEGDEDREDGQARVEEESVGPADDSGKSAGSQKAGGNYEGDVVALDEENDPDWYRAHMSTYPCYKLTEGAMFNLQLLKNLDQDWSTPGADTKHPSTVYFNLCHYTDTSNCNGNKEDSFAYRTDETGNCEMLTSDSPQAEIAEEVTRQSPSDPDTEQKGIRIMRAGGDDCPSDNTRMLQFTLDVYCNEDASRNPQAIKSIGMAPDDDEADPCTVYVALEHAAGCPELDFSPMLNILGVVMIFFGVVLQYFGRKVQRLFMRFLVSVATFLIVMGICFKLNWLALFDPTEPDQNKSVFLAFFSILLAMIAVTIINYLFKKFLRLAPTFIGLCAGFWFSIYLIAAVNGIGGMFVPAAAAGSKDVIGPVWGAVIEGMVSILGGLIGYNYSAVFILLIQTFVSAYLIVRGSTLIINLGFPNEIVLMQSVSNETNGLVRLPTSFYLYSATILGLWGGSFYFQLVKEWEEGTLEKFDDDDD